MKILNLKEFRSLPNNTPFWRVNNYGYPEGQLCFKGDSVGDIDYMSVELPQYEEVWDSGQESEELQKRCQAAQGGLHPESIDLDTECETRDGAFDTQQLFLVFEPEDALKMMKAFLPTAIQSPNFTQKALFESSDRTVPEPGD